MNERLMYFRKTVGITKERMAEQLNLTEQDIWDMETGKKEITEAIQRDMQEKFGVNLRWLQTGRGRMMINKK